MTTLSNIARKTGSVLVKNSPAILTGLGAAGLVTTSYLVGKASMDVGFEIGWEEAEYKLRGEYDNPPLGAVDILKLRWKSFIPGVAMGAVSIACIIGANSISSRRNAALISLYTLTEGAFQEYKEKVVEQIGATKAQKIRDDVAQDVVTRSELKSTDLVVITNGDVPCFDSFTGRPFMSSVEKLRKAQNDINLKCINEMYASQNDFYALIGLDAVSLGEQVGWTTDNEMDLEFSAVLTEDGKPCLVVQYRKGPTPNFYKVW
jgi:hypothetical protein